MKPATLHALVRGDINNAIMSETPGGIEAQEAAGQHELCQTSRLPRQMLHGCTRERLEAMGIVFHGEVDDLFVAVTLPDGWAVVPTEHHMWNELIDEKKRKRAAIFYKAAFCDRSSHISLNCRYRIDGYRDAGNDTFATAVVDADKVLFETEPRRKDEWAKGDQQYDKAKAWLTEHFPDWDSPLAYWD